MQQRICNRCQRVFDRESVSRVTQRLGASPTVQKTVQLCDQCLREFDMMQLVYEDGMEIIVSRAFYCRVCKADISASLNRNRKVCSRCEVKLRQTERRVARIHRNSYARPSMDW